MAAADLASLCVQGAALVRAGRLNKHYPDPEVAAGYLEEVAEAARRGLLSETCLDPASGLPTLKLLMGVQVDGRIASDLLEAVACRRRSGRIPTGRLAAKEEYCRALLERALPPLHRLDVRLRRVDEAQGLASFLVVVDRFDPGAACFERWTLLLDQADRAWCLAREDDYSRPTEDFRHHLETVTGGESEISFLLLTGIPGVRVEEVIRTRIGPLWSAWNPPPPAWLPQAGAFQGAVLHLPMEHVSVHLEQDRDGDPFATLYRKFLSWTSRPLIEAESRRLGYRTHKDRKFVASAQAAAALRERLAAAGTRNILYEA